MATRTTPTGDRMTLDALLDELRAVFGADLQTVLLYGSTAVGQEIARRSDYNVLVIVRTLPLELLEDGGAHIEAWVRAGNPPPLVLTLDEWRSSADVFPMEYADILEQHRALHGTLPVDGIEVDAGALRLAAEREAMGKLLQLRRGVLAAGGDPNRRAELLVASLSTFLAIFRGTLRVHGVRPGPDAERVCRETARLAGIDAVPFLRVLDHKRGRGAIPPADVHDVLGGYLTGIERLVAHLDQATPAGRVG